MAWYDFLTQKKRNVDDKRFFTQLLRGNSEISESEQNDITYINKGYRINPTVFAIINMVAKNAGMVKWGIYKKDNDNTLEPYVDTKLQALMQQPNGLMTWNQLIQEAISFKMLTGNAYFWHDSSGNADRLYLLPSQHVQIHASKNNKAIAGYGLDFYGRSNDEIIPADEVLHLKNFNPRYDGTSEFLYGQAPLKAALGTLYTNNDAIETSRSYLINQGPRGILTTEIDDTYGAMTEEQIAALRNRFRMEQTGAKKAGQLLITPGKWKWEDIGSSSADLKLIEHYKLTVNDICNAFQFPTILISDGNSTFSNQKEAKKALWTNVIIPTLQEIRDGLNCWLAPKFGEELCLDFSVKDIKELQEDIEKQANAISKLQNVITVNEARAMIGKAPLDGPEGEEIYRFVQGVEDGESGSSGESKGPEKTTE